VWPVDEPKLTNVRVGALAKARETIPWIPTHGRNDIPLRDEIEFKRRPTMPSVAVASVTKEFTRICAIKARPLCL